MKVRKDNRVLTVDEADKAFYLSEGYEVVVLNKDKNTYEVAEPATGGKSYTIAEMEAVKKQHQDEIAAMADENGSLSAKVLELSAQLEAAKSPEMSRDEIKAALTEKGIEFKGNASTEDLKKLLEDSK